MPLQPTRDDVASLAAYDEERFARWLAIGFGDEPTRGRHAFGPMKTFIGLEADPVEDVAKLYKLLTPGEQIRFRHGLASALARTPLSPDTIGLIESLLGLASQIQAAEVLPVIAEKHRRNWVTAEIDDQELFDATLRCVMELSTNAGPTLHGEANFAILTDFAAADRLPSAYAEPLFIAMCRVRPHEAWLNFRDLRRHLDAEFAPAEDEAEDEARADLARDLVNQTYEVLAEQAFRKMLQDALEDTTDYRRDWWLMAAFGERRAALRPRRASASAPAPAPAPAQQVAPSAPVPIPTAANDTEDVFNRFFRAAEAPSGPAARSRES